MTDGKRPSIESPNASSVAFTRFRCPCCGYPTLPNRHRFTFCSLCGWDNDGQDDSHADEVWGGPNGPLSLSQARDNFRDHLSKYDADDPMSEPYGMRVTEAKRAMVAAFEGMKDDFPIERHEELWQRVLACKQVLREEGSKSVYDDDWQKERTKKQWAYWERRYGIEWVQKRREQIALSRRQIESARAMREGTRESDLQ